MRDALRSNWEAYSSVRFVGWQDCTRPTQAQRGKALGLKISPSTVNNSSTGIGSRGGTTGFSTWGTLFVQPEPHPAECISYDGARARMAYRFSCVREYAVHEVGHAIGFAHQWRHPLTPNSFWENCIDKAEPPAVASDASPIYDPNKRWTL